MPVRFHCQDCETLLSVGRKKIGQQLDCPKCGAVVTVPAVDAVTGQAVEPKRRRSGDRDEPAPGEQAEQPVAAEQSVPASGSAGAAATSSPSSAATTSPGAAGNRPRQPIHVPSSPEENDEDFNPEFVVFDDDDDDDELSAIAVVAPPARAAPPAGGSTPPAPATAKPSSPDPTRLPPGYVIISKGRLAAQFLFFLCLAVGAFAGGYFVGRADAPADTGKPEETAATAVPKPTVAVEGTITYQSPSGTVQPDARAVIIALPTDRRPDQPLRAAALHPGSEVDLNYRQVVLAIEELGGTVVTATAEGEFTLTLPETGPYYLLMISANARSDDGMIPREDRDLMKRYFAEVESLIQRQQYSWRKLAFDQTWVPLDPQVFQDESAAS